jgi:hypothetical protein
MITIIIIISRRGAQDTASMITDGVPSWFNNPQYKMRSAGGAALCASTCLSSPCEDAAGGGGGDGLNKGRQ